MEAFITGRRPGEPMARIWRKGEWRELRPGVWAMPLSHDERCILMLFRIKDGGEVPVHSHPEAQYGLVLKGRGVFQTEEGEVEVEEGDSYAFAPGERHGFKALEETLVIDVFTPTRPDYASLAREPDIS